MLRIRKRKTIRLNRCKTLCVFQGCGFTVAPFWLRRKNVDTEIAGFIYFIIKAVDSHFGAVA